MSSPSKEAKSRKTNKESYAAGLLALVFICCVGLLRSSTEVRVGETKDFSHLGTKTILPEDWDVWEGCTISKVEEARSASADPPTKPFWFPNFPSSAVAMKDMVESMLGGGIVRNFYTKKCKPYEKTILCDQIHPIVPISPLPEAPDRLKEFHASIIVPIRNPMTAHPAYHQNKAELYHHAEGQVSEESWRQTRDAWYNGTFHQWEDLIDTWKVMPYGVSMYVPFEHIIDPAKGPETVKRLFGVLKNAGFPAKVTEESIPCVWYQAVGKDRLVTHHEHGYEYTDYLPGFTQEQKQFYMEAFERLIRKYSDDKELVEILKEYRDDVQNHMRIDRPHAEESS